MPDIDDVAAEADMSDGSELERARAEEFRSFDRYINAIIDARDPVAIIECEDCNARVLDFNAPKPRSETASASARGGEDAQVDKALIAIGNASFKDRAEKAESERDAALRDAARLREAMKKAPRPHPSEFDQVAYMDWYFTIRASALSAPASGGSLPSDSKETGDG